MILSGKCGKIQTKQGRLLCPACGKALPGELEPGAVIIGYVLQCRQCGRKIKIHLSGQRPTAPGAH